MTKVTVGVRPPLSPLLALMTIGSLLVGLPTGAATPGSVDVAFGGPGWLSVVVDASASTQVRASAHVSVHEFPSLVGFGSVKVTDGTADFLRWALLGLGFPEYKRLKSDIGIQIDEGTEAGSSPDGRSPTISTTYTLAAGRHQIALFLAWTPPDSAGDLVLSVSGDNMEVVSYASGPEAAMFQDRDFDPRFHAEDSTVDDRYNVMALGKVSRSFDRSTTAFLTSFGPLTRQGEDVLRIEGPYACPAYVHNLLLRGAPPGAYTFHVLAHATTDKKGVTVEPVTILPIHTFTRPVLLVADLPIPVQAANVHLPVLAPCGPGLA